MTKEKFVCNFPASFVCRIIVEQRLHNRCSLFMSFLHNSCHITLHGFTKQDIVTHHILNLRCVAPDFIVGTRSNLTAACCAKWLVVRITVAVQTHNRAECTKLEPAHQKLMEGWIMYISAMEATDICCPPCNSGKTHV